MFHYILTLEVDRCGKRTAWKLTIVKIPGGTTSCISITLSALPIQRNRSVIEIEKIKGIKKIELKSSNIQTILTFKTVLIHQLNYIFLWIFFTCISHDDIFHHFCKNDQKGVFFLVERKREITVINMALLSLLMIYVTMCIYFYVFTVKPV